MISKVWAVIYVSMRWGGRPADYIMTRAYKLNRTFFGVTGSIHMLPLRCRFKWPTDGSRGRSGASLT